MAATRYASLRGGVSAVIVAGVLAGTTYFSLGQRAAPVSPIPTVNAGSQVVSGLSSASSGAPVVTSSARRSRAS